MLFVLVCWWSHPLDAHAALADASLQKALLNVGHGFVAKRAAAKAELPEFDTLREEARAIKDHTLSHLDLYLEAYERKVTESGGAVHYARDAAEARDIVLRLCQEARAKLVTKGKSMIGEEIAAARGLIALGTELLQAASSRIEQATHHPVHLYR